MTKVVFQSTSSGLSLGGRSGGGAQRGQVQGASEPHLCIRVTIPPYPGWMGYPLTLLPTQVTGLSESFGYTFQYFIWPFMRKARAARHALPLGAPRPRVTGAPSVSMRIALGAVLRPKVREHRRFLLGRVGQRTAPRVMWWPPLPTHQIRPQSRRTGQS